MIKFALYNVNIDLYLFKFTLNHVCHLHINDYPTYYYLLNNN